MRIFLFFSAMLLARFQVVAEGFIPVINFTKTVYPGGAQNWDVAQDDLGKIYVANRDGMVSFDGQRWDLAYLPNYTTVRTLLYDHNSSRIYAAGSEEFGYFSYAPGSPTIKYSSFMENFDSERPTFSEIWNILNTDDCIWFQADNYMFCLKEDKIKVYETEGRISTSAVINSKLYLGFENGKVSVFENGQFRSIPGLNLLSGHKIVAILPYAHDGILIGTSFDGLYLMTDGRLEAFDSSINSFLKENQLFCAASKGSDYVFGTVNAGAVLADFKSDKYRYINKFTGLQNNTVLNIKYDKANNIWLCLDNGLDYVISNSAVSNLINHDNSIGAGYASLVVGNKIFYGTNQGLFSTEYPFRASFEPMHPVRHLQGQIWSLTRTGDNFFIASDAGAFYFDGNNFKRIGNIAGTYKILELPNSDDLAIASTYEAFHLLANVNGQWIDKGVINGYNDIGGIFIFDKNGNIWLPHWRKGVYKLTLNNDKTTFSENILYNSNNGLPSNQNNSVSLIGNDIYFSTEAGIYRYSDGILSPDQKLNEIFWKGSPGVIHELPDKSLAFIDNSGLSLAYPALDGNLTINMGNKGMLRGDIIPGFTDINYISPSEIIVSTQEGFSNISRTSSSDKKWSPKPFISALYANNDSLVFSSSLNTAENQFLTLPYDLNSLKFEFAYPVYDSTEKVEFSSYLENYDSDWSIFSTQSTREYTKLDYGNYVMHLRVRDTDTGEISETALAFRILPPWYLSPLAKVTYFVAGFIIIIILLKLIRKKIIKTQKRLATQKEKELQELKNRTEQETLMKDFEIANLKADQLEQDVKFRTQELNNTTLSLARKNEILTGIVSQISSIQKIAQTETPNSSVSRQLAKIIVSIEKNISKEDDLKSFMHNFDIVYGDFNQRLEISFPNLSAYDKRLCCYIRMGLSTKEIAPLINISIKSVEMARYRLRKKINLPADSSLTDYLKNF